ncbi:MAG TPA: PPOX class F420-dependent oxidoreductase [Acidimicrobiales bacterium]
MARTSRPDPTRLTEPELRYLATQRLGRLATIAPDGTLQNNPVGFHYNPDLGTIDIFGFRMGATRKFRNVWANPHVAFVVDDIASVDPWVVRGIEIRGTAQALSDQHGLRPGLSNEIIRIHPGRIIAWNVEAAVPAGEAVRAS